jgi:hypothetical protein
MPFRNPFMGIFRRMADLTSGFYSGKPARELAEVDCPRGSLQDGLPLICLPTKRWS